MDYHLAGESGNVNDKASYYRILSSPSSESTTDMLIRAEEVYKAMSGRLPSNEPRRSSLDALWELCNQRQAPDSKEDIAAACGVPVKWVPANHADLSEEDLVSAVEEARDLGQQAEMDYHLETT